MNTAIPLLQPHFLEWCPNVLASVRHTNYISSIIDFFLFFFLYIGVGVRWCYTIRMLCCELHFVCPQLQAHNCVVVQFLLSRVARGILPNSKKKVIGFGVADEQLQEEVCWVSFA